jgi:hypothetical protein
VSLRVSRLEDPSVRQDRQLGISLRQNPLLILVPCPLSLVRFSLFIVPLGESEGARPLSRAQRESGRTADREEDADLLLLRRIA